MESGSFVFRFRICLDYYGKSPINYRTVNIVAPSIGSATRFLFSAYQDIHSYEVLSQDIVYIADYGNY